MKKIFYVLSISALSFFACDSDDDGPSFNPSVVLNEQIDISVPSGVLTPAYNSTQSLAISDNDLNGIPGTLSAVNVDSITLEIDDYVGAPEIELDYATVSILTASGQVLGTAIISDTSARINLNDFDDANAIIRLNTDGGLTETIEETLLADRSIQIRVIGELSDAPVDFNVQINLYLSLTGS